MAVYSAAHGYLFLNSPQTASTATAKTLVERLGGTELHELMSRAEQSTCRQLQHMDPQALLERDLLTQDEYDRALKVTGVRNPFDLLVSRYLKRARPVVPFAERTDLLRRPGKEKLHREAELTAQLSFPEWIKAKFERRTVAAGQGKFTDAADHVLRFEALEEDFQSFLDRIGVREPIKVDPFNVSPQRQDEASLRRIHYAEFYDADSRSIVARVFAPTIERFGYSFQEY